MQSLGLGPVALLPTLAWAFGWLLLMLAYSPVADRIATRMIAEPPNLRAFAGLQNSMGKLIAGIVLAWMLGGFIEELILRGIILRAVAGWLTPHLPAAAAVAIAICAAGATGGIAHLYQGRRAALIITQLSLLFGVLYAVSGYNLWTVILCHGAYDTIAFIRFAAKRSKYAKLEGSV